jgi:starch-binding outer membrane protein, SusD/RagB family
MKISKKIIYAALIAIVLLSNSCKKLLEEHPQSQIVPSYFNTPEGLLGGLAGAYDQLRNSWGTEGFTVAQMAGTDDHLMGGSAGNPRLFSYNGIQTGDFNGAFGLYTSINTLNGILEIGAASSLPDATKKIYLAQAKFLRAFIYFYLVQTFGSIPLHTTYITVPSAGDSKAPVADIYALIIKDATDAAADLPDKPTAPFLGKAATKPAALFLLAKAYLTRGWVTNSTADFTSSYTTAAGIITNKATYGLDMWDDYLDAFRPANDYGKETIFVSDHSNDSKYGNYILGSSGNDGNNLTPNFQRFNYAVGGAIGINSTKNSAGKIAKGGSDMLFRDVNYGRPYTRLRPNIDKVTTGPNTGKSYILDQAFYDRINDSRYDNTFQTIWIANLTTSGTAGYSGTGITGSRGTLNLGTYDVLNNTVSAGADTAVWFPDYEVPGAPQAFDSRPFKGIIVTPSMQTNTVYPTMKKYDDPGRAAPNDPSRRPLVIWRFSEVYLIAAEAALKGGGTAQQAYDMLIAVRTRASHRANYPVGVTRASAEAAQIAATPAPGALTIDYILDERTRELFGEGCRWLDLVRTKSLLSRIAAWNPVESGTYIKSFNVLRPIPQDQIDRVTEGSNIGSAYWQNPGY